MSKYQYLINEVWEPSWSSELNIDSNDMDCVTQAILEEQDAEEPFGEESNGDTLWVQKEGEEFPRKFSISVRTIVEFKAQECTCSSGENPSCGLHGYYFARNL